MALNSVDSLDQLFILLDISQSWNAIFIETNIPFKFHISFGLSRLLFVKQTGLKSN
jgi:hypothetical protein